MAAAACKRARPGCTAAACRPGLGRPSRRSTGATGNEQTQPPLHTYRSWLTSAQEPSSSYERCQVRTSALNVGQRTRRPGRRLQRPTHSLSRPTPTLPSHPHPPARVVPAPHLNSSPRGCSLLPAYTRPPRAAAAAANAYKSPGRADSLASAVGCKAPGWAAGPREGPGPWPRGPEAAGRRRRRRRHPPLCMYMCAPPRHATLRRAAAPHARQAESALSRRRSSSCRCPRRHRSSCRHGRRGHRARRPGRRARRRSGRRRPCRRSGRRRPCRRGRQTCGRASHLSATQETQRLRAGPRLCCVSSTAIPCPWCATPRHAMRRAAPPTCRRRRARRQSRRARPCRRQSRARRRARR